jgi:hypothetical protein
MDVYELAQKYDLTVRKAKRMEKDGVLRTGKSTLPIHWRRTRESIPKGKMSALAIALAYRFPDKLESIMTLTAAGEKFIERNIQKYLNRSLIKNQHPLQKCLHGWALDMIENSTDGINFIEILEYVIPDFSVDYHYIAVNMLLMCDNEMPMVYFNKSIRPALLTSIEHPSMEGWWHREHVSKGKYRIIYHRPETRIYDL